MKKEVIRVEPLSTYLENWKAPTSAVTRSGGRDNSISKWIASPFERTPPSKTAMASIVFK
jgi:hypothetical protein